MAWTQDIVIKLIKEYRKQEVLWNARNPNYYNKISKAQAWKDIAQEMDLPERVVKSKVDNFSAQLRREKANMMKMTKRGFQFTSSWYGFEHLRFLLNKKQYRRQIFSEGTSENNSSETQDLQVPQTNNPSNESTLKQPTEKLLTPKNKNVGTENRSMKKYVHKVNRMTKSVNTENQQMNYVGTNNRTVTSAYGKLASTSNKVKDVSATFATNSSATNADQIYANFIATKFRMYSQQTKNVLQYKISNLLFQADTGVFDNDQPNVTLQQKTRASRTASQETRANERGDSLSPSSENKRARRTSSEDQTPVSLKIEDNSDLEDPLNVDYEDFI